MLRSSREIGHTARIAANSVALVRRSGIVLVAGTQVRCKELTEQAFQAYIARDFETSVSLYQRLTESFPDDGVGPLFVRRCEEYLRDPRGPDWTGITRMTTK